MTVLARLRALGGRSKPLGDFWPHRGSDPVSGVRPMPRIPMEFSYASSLDEWLQAACPGVTVALGPLGGVSAKGDGSSPGREASVTQSRDLLAYWIQFRPATEALRPRGTDRPIRLFERYLLCLPVGAGGDFHGKLVRVLIAALDDTVAGVDLGALTPEAWLQLGLPPRPGFLLDLPVRETRSREVAAPVREVTLDVSGVNSLTGIVYWRHGGPAAHVEVQHCSGENAPNQIDPASRQAGGRIIRTATDGSFRLAVPKGAGPPSLRVRALGEETFRSPSAMRSQGGQWFLELENSRSS